MVLIGSAVVAAPIVLSAPAYAAPTCSWGGYTNGSVPLAAMSIVSGNGAEYDNWDSVGSNGDLGVIYLEPSAATSLRSMMADYQTQSGGDQLHPNEGYRNFAGQTYWFQRGLSPTPGTSNHGCGLAVDFSFSGSQRDWVVSHGASYGYVQLAGDPVHFNYVGTTSGTTPASSGQPSIVSLGADGSLMAKTGIYGGWVPLLGGVADVAAATDAAGTPVIAALGTDGIVRTKVGLNGTWLTQIGNVKSIAIATQPGGSTLAVVRTDGTLQAKAGLESTWTTLGGGVSSVSIAADPTNPATITALYADGTLRAKTGIQGPWVDLAGAVAKVDSAADTRNGPSWVITRTSGLTSVKVGMNGTWTDITGTSIEAKVASDPTNGLTIVSTDSSRSLYGKTGVTGPWVGLLDHVTSADVASSATLGTTIAAVSDGTLFAKSGLGGNWVQLGSAAKVVVSN